MILLLLLHPNQIGIHNAHVSIHSIIDLSKEEIIMLVKKRCEWVVVQNLNRAQPVGDVDASWIVRKQINKHKSKE